jgi:hypothetical protein
MRRVAHTWKVRTDWPLSCLVVLAGRTLAFGALGCGVAVESRTDESASPVMRADVGPDSASDAALEAGADAGPDAASDAASDASSEGESETGSDAGSDAGPDAGPHPPLCFSAGGPPAGDSSYTGNGCDSSTGVVDNDNPDGACGPISTTDSTAYCLASQPPPATFSIEGGVINVAEMPLGGPTVYLSGYGLYTPPTSPPSYDPNCYFWDDTDNQSAMPTQCVSNGGTTYVVLLANAGACTASADSAPAGNAAALRGAAAQGACNEWRHEMKCWYGQVFGGGGLARDEWTQTAGGNNNGVTRGSCVVGGLAGAVGSIYGRIDGVPNGDPTGQTGSIALFGASVGVFGVRLPTYGCIVQIWGSQTTTYFGCSYVPVVGAFAFGNAVALQF